jgi:hypothetical protein
VPNGRVIGKVVAVSGSQIVATLEAEQPAGAPQPRVEKGHLVKIRLPETLAFGIVSGLSVPVPGAEGEVWLAELVLLGECPIARPGRAGAFRRGLSAYPALGDRVLQTDEQDLLRLYGADAQGRLVIGTLHQTGDQPVCVDADTLLGKHFALIGATGCGKSCAAASLLHALIRDCPDAHLLILDPHGEYGAAFTEEAVLLGPETLQLPYWLLTGEELAEVVSGGARDGPVRHATEILAQLVPRAKRLYREPRPEDPTPTVDTPVPYRLSDLERLIDEAMGRLDKPDTLAPYRWLRSRLATLARDPRFSFMFGGIAVHDTMARTLSTLFRIPAAGRPVTVIDLSGIPNEVLAVVVSVILRLAFDLAYWSGGKLPVLIVCEEAHRYAPIDAARGFLPARRAMDRIAKEGRKYGISLGVVTQRPSELEPSVLSQCNTVFAFRVTSPEDQELMQGLLRDDANGLLDFLPSLGDAEAIVLGQAVPIPLRVRFPLVPPERRPRSASPSFSAAWRLGGDEVVQLDELVRAWRRR